MVERYVAGITEEQVSDGVARLREATAQMTAEGVNLRYLGTTFVPSEGSVFSLFEGLSEQSIQEVNQRAGFPPHRLVEAILLGREASEGS
jgi:hypothetical protein